MVDTKHLELLSEKLETILSVELHNGNTVAETWSGWPYKESIVIMLEKPFTVDFDVHELGVHYSFVNDPHYWKAEYIDSEHWHVLACRF